MEPNKDDSSSMSPDISRRNLLVGIGALGGAYGVSTQIGIGEITMWTPPEDQWPLERYDLRRTGATAATPPQNPSKKWTARPLANTVTLVVGSERVYAGTDLYGTDKPPGMVALNRSDGTIVWTASVEGGALALYEGTLYAKAHGPGDGAVVALDAATGTKLWQATHSGGVEEIMPTAETVFFEHSHGIAAVDANSGRNRWSTRSGSAGAIALSDGDLFGGISDILRYEPRRVSDVAFGNPPPTSWAYNAQSVFPDLVVVDDTLLVSSYLTIADPELRSLHAVDLSDGTRRWWAVRGQTSTGNASVATVPLAVDDGVVFHRLRRGEDENRSHALIARTLSDGSKRWEMEFQNWVSDLAVADGTLLVAQSLNPQTHWRGVRAFDRAGNERWRVRTRRDPATIAPVEGAVLVGDDVGRVLLIS